MPYRPSFFIPRSGFGIVQPYNPPENLSPEGINIFLSVRLNKLYEVIVHPMIY